MESRFLHRSVSVLKVCKEPQRVATADCAECSPFAKGEFTLEAPANASDDSVVNARVKKTRSRRLLPRLCFTIAWILVSLLSLSNDSTVAAASRSASSTSSIGSSSETDHAEDDLAAPAFAHRLRKVSAPGGMQQPALPSSYALNLIESGTGVDSAFSFYDTNNNNNFNMAAQGTPAQSHVRAHQASPLSTPGVVMDQRAKAVSLGAPGKQPESSTSVTHPDFPPLFPGPPSDASPAAAREHNGPAAAQAVSVGRQPEKISCVPSEAAADLARVAGASSHSDHSSGQSVSTLTFSPQYWQEGLPYAARDRDFAGPLPHDSSHCASVVNKSSSLPGYHKKTRDYLCSSACSFVPSSPVTSSGNPTLPRQGQLRDVSISQIEAVQRSRKRSERSNKESRLLASLSLERATRFIRSRLMSRTKTNGSAASVPRVADNHAEDFAGAASPTPVEGAAPPRELVGSAPQTLKAGEQNVAKAPPESVIQQTRPTAASFGARRPVDTRTKERSDTSGEREAHTTTTRLLLRRNHSVNTLLQNKGSEDQIRPQGEKSRQYSIQGSVPSPRAKLAAGVSTPLGAVRKSRETSLNYGESVTVDASELGKQAASSEKTSPAARSRIAASFNPLCGGGDGVGGSQERPYKYTTFDSPFPPHPESPTSDGTREDGVVQQQRRQRKREEEEEEEEEEWMALRMHLELLQQDAERVVRGVPLDESASHSIPPCFTLPHEDSGKTTVDLLSRFKQTKKKHKHATQDGASRSKSLGSTMQPKPKSLLRTLAVGHQRFKAGFSDLMSRTPNDVYVSLPCFCGSAHSSRLEAITPSAAPSGCPQDSTSSERGSQGGVPAAEAAEAVPLRRRKGESAEGDPRDRHSRASTSSSSSVPGEPAVSVWGRRPKPRLFDVTSFRSKHDNELRTEAEKHSLELLIQRLLRVELWLASLPDDVTFEQP